MAGQTPGNPQIEFGSYSNECVAENDLIRNSAKWPVIRDWIEYVQGRTMTTLFTTPGAITPYGINYNLKPNVPNVDTKTEGKGIGSDDYRFRIMGRIENNAPIVSQVGTSGADGSFTLKMLGTELNIGDNPVFYGGRKVARVMAGPRQTAGGYLYDFQTPNREVFSWSTWVAPQSGTKFCFAGWTTFGEKSLRGYGYSKFPDMFIQHMTTQRQSISITGDANTQVLWMNYMGTDGRLGKGWMYEAINQTRAKLAIQNERNKIFGISSMKNPDGTLAATSNLVDPQTGLPIIQGDGIENQIANGNVVYGSGTNGQVTIDDITDLMMSLQQQGQMVTGYEWLFITGSVGFENLQRVAAAHLGNQNCQVLMPVDKNSQKAGGDDVSAGYTFMRINFAGNSITFAQHPLFDDRWLGAELGRNGKSILSATIMVIPMNGRENGKPLIEILHKAEYGINRSMVEGTLNGMTGDDGMVISQEDARTYACLKQDMINVYNTQMCAIIYPGSNY